MLHWSQEASTGWTRNSWGCSMAKRACLSLVTGLGRERRIGTGRRTESTIRPRSMHDAASRCARAGPHGSSTQPAGRACLRLTRATLAATLARVGVPGGGGARTRDRDSVTASEFSFLALGLVLGLVTGAALVELFRARPPSSHEVRLTVAHDAIPRRSATLADDAFVAAGPEPARGGPADRRLGAAPATSGPAERRTNVRYEWPVATGPPAVDGRRDPDRTWTSGPAPIPVGSWSRPSPHRHPAGADQRARGTMVGIPISGGDDPVLGGPPERGWAGARSTRPPRDSRPPPTPAPPAAPVPAPATATAAEGVAVATAVGLLEPQMPKRGPGGRSDSPIGATRTPRERCAEERRLADERCELATRARAQADAAINGLRLAQRSYDEHEAGGGHGVVEGGPARRPRGQGRGPGRLPIRGRGRGQSGPARGGRPGLADRDQPDQQRIARSDDHGRPRARRGPRDRCDPRTSRAGGRRRPDLSGQRRCDVSRRPRSRRRVR